MLAATLQASAGVYMLRLYMVHVVGMGAGKLDGSSLLGPSLLAEGDVELLVAGLAVLILMYVQQGRGWGWQYVVPLLQYDTQAVLVALVHLVGVVRGISTVQWPGLCTQRLWCCLLAPLLA